MKVSIVTVNYNNYSGLKRTIESVLSQTCQDFEYVIIDGGSTDKSVELIRNYSDKITYWISEPDSGIYNAMNKGIQHSKGKYIAFMNSGDYYLENDSLEQCLNEISRYDADIYYGQHFVVHDNVRKKAIYPKTIFIEYLRNKVLNHQSCFFERETLSALGGYDERFKLAADYHYYLKAFVENKKFHPMLFPVAMYDLTGKSSTQFAQYKVEMENAWNDIMPPWLKPLVDKYTSLEKNYKDLKYRFDHSRVLKFALKLTEIKRKIFHGRH